MKFDTPATTNPIDQLKIIGKPTDRIDGPLKTTGTARYAYERNTEVPNAARMYDYYLGGLHNFPADREMAQRVVGAYPALPAVLQQNRAFLRRAVRYMVREGIRQFIDLGSGLPTVGNVHEVAQAEAPDTKVVYVDVDPTAVLHSRLMLVGNPAATVLQRSSTIRAP